MTSCGWHGWPARSSRANLSRPARLPLVADQVSPAVTLAAMARQVFSLLPAHHPSVGAHRRPERVGSAFSDDCGRIRYHRPGRYSLETILVEGLCDAPAERLGSNVHHPLGRLRAGRFDARSRAVAVAVQPIYTAAKRSACFSPPGPCWRYLGARIRARRFPFITAVTAAEVGCG